MKATVEELNSVQKRINVELSAEEVAKAFTSAYQRLRKKAKIKGFRPGKAPVAMLKRFYGDSVAHEVADALIKNHLFSAIAENEIRPVASPVLEKIDQPKEGSEFNFSAVIDFMPPIALKDYKGLEAEVPKIAYTDKMLEDEMFALQRRQGKTKEVAPETTIEAGMLAKIDQESTLDGEAFPNFTVSEAQVEVGAGQVLKETEDNLIGLKVGEEREFIVVLPDDFPEKEHSGKTVNCKLKVTGLQELVVPEVNDEFAKDMGLETADDLKSKMEENIKNKIDEMNRQQLELALLTNLNEKHPFDVPPSIVDDVIDNLISEQIKDAQEKELAKKDQKVRDSFKQRAQFQTKNSLLLQQIIAEEKLEVDDTDIDKYLEGFLGSLEADKKDAAKESLRSSVNDQVKQNLLFTKALDFLIENANVTEIAD